MAEQIPRQKILHLYLPWFVLPILLAPWLWLKTQVTINPDILWLCICLRRILAGGLMSEVAYEVNPPMSMLVHILPVLAESNLGWSLDYMLVLQALLILGLSVYVLWKSLAQMLPSRMPGFAAIIIGFMLATTVMTGVSFGERDHLLAMVLLPFTLLQFLITQGRFKATLSSRIFMGMAVMLMLLKPHYGFIPVGMLLHRIWVRKDLSFLKDVDFLTLSAVTLGYAGVMWVFFQDYLFVILPDVLKYYQLSQYDQNLYLTVTSLCVGGFFLLTLVEYLAIEKATKGVCKYFLLLSAVSLIPVLLQGTGYFYHYIPAIVAAACVVSVVFSHLIHSSKVRHANLISALIMVGLAYLYAPPSFSYARHATYAELQLPQEIIEANSKSEVKGFLIMNRFLGLGAEVSQYTGIQYASRFSTLWFMPGLEHYRRLEEAGALTAEEQLEARADRARFARMMAEDIERYRPPILLFQRLDLKSNQSDALDFFKSSADIQRAMGPYSYARDLHINENDYYGFGFTNRWPTVLRVYERQENEP